MWELNIACEKIVEMVIEERNKQPHCIICDGVLFDHDKYFFALLDDLQYRKRKIRAEMYNDIKNYFFTRYPYYYEDLTLSGHHTNYKKNIQVPTCKSCHSKIHHGSDPELAKWKPVDKRPKRSHMLEKNLYKPLNKL